MKILVFGNILVKEDNLALKLIPLLKGEFPEIEFKEFDPTENLEGEIEEGKLMILDVAIGINEMKVIEDIGMLDIIKSCSMHDFDLTFNLKLFKKIGKLKKVKIIAIPMNLNEDEALNQLQLILRKCVAQDIQGS